VWCCGMVAFRGSGVFGRNGIEVIWRSRETKKEFGESKRSSGKVKGVWGQ
jgi:hypothetical protein